MLEQELELCTVLIQIMQLDHLQSSSILFKKNKKKDQKSGECKQEIEFLWP